MKLSIFLSLFICIANVYAIVIQPQPTRTADVLKRGGQQETGAPTPVPKNHFIKRDIEDTLSLYENWAYDCTNNDNNANIAVSGLNNLWQTVTSTVYCGNGNVKTITKTITATKGTVTTTVGGGSSGSSGNGGGRPSCDAKCWSTYLWRMYNPTTIKYFEGVMTPNFIFRYIWLWYQCCSRLYRYCLHAIWSLLFNLWL
jgi:hypothetical protein